MKWENTDEKSSKKSLKNAKSSKQNFILQEQCAFRGHIVTCFTNVSALVTVTSYSFTTRSCTAVTDEIRS